MRTLVFFIIAIIFLSAAHPHDVRAAGNTVAQSKPFAEWLVDLRAEALSKGISASTLEETLTGLKPIPRVIELDRRQPEFTWTFRKYMESLVNQQRVTKGKKKLVENAKLLNKIGKKYGIQPRFLVAFWGLETDYGRLAEGYFSTIAALATLAHDGRRGAFFREQLLTALKIIDQGHITPQRMKGSWAGAMGHFQFIPTTFDAYATDYDGDGKIDIWGNQGDAYASAANFLTKSGWKADEIWGREVALPKGFDFNLATMKVRKPLADWQAMGVRKVGGANLPMPANSAMTASIIAPAGAHGPAFLVYGNFRTIMVWNRSTFYALGIGQLADRLVGLPQFTTLGPKDGFGLSFEEGRQLQQRLSAMGFDTGGVDGVVGPKSRDAIRNFQRAAGLVPDGYPSRELWERVQKGL